MKSTPCEPTEHTSANANRGHGERNPHQDCLSGKLQSNLFDEAYLALGGKTSSKMSRRKLPTGQILSCAENLALDKTAQQVSANKTPWSNFCFTRRNLLSQNGRLSRYTGLQIAIKPSLKSPEKRDNHLLYPISWYKPVLSSIRQIVLKVVLRKYYSRATVILLWLACLDG